MTDAQSYLALQPGTMLQEFRIDRVLGIGSFGIVYAATGQYFSDTVAIKEFLPSDLATRIEGTRVVPVSSNKEEAYEWARKKFLREAQILWEIARPEPHRNIAHVTRFLEEHGTAYMVMDYEIGESLSSVLHQRKRLPQREIEALLFPLLQGLKRVHAANVWHRDIKPDNILIREDKSPVLIDFGAAHQEVPDADRSMMAVYSPAYAAPEQVFGPGEQGPWTDIYSLAATLYRAVTGSSPPSASERLMGAPYEPLTDLSPDGYDSKFLGAIDAALSLKVENRPQCIENWLRLFAPAVGTPPPPERRKSWIVPAIAIVLFLGIGAGIWFVVHPYFDSERTPVTLSGTLLPEAREPVDAPAIPDESADQQGTAVAPSEKPSGPPVPNLLRARIAALTESVRCGAVTASLDNDMHVRLIGHVGEPGDRFRVLSGISAIEGVTGVSDEIDVVGDPFCEVVEVLSPIRRADANGRSGVSIMLAGNKESFDEGDPFIVHATASYAFDGYLYLDYMDSQSNTIHLLPSGDSDHKSVQAGETITVGEAEKWIICPPHGQSMLIAIHSSEPLFEEKRDLEEEVGEYLPALRSALKRAREGDAYSKPHINYELFSTRSKVLDPNPCE